MPTFEPKFSLHVAGNDILVTLQGTSYAVTYFKRRGSPGLFAGRARGAVLGGLPYEILRSASKSEPVAARD